MRSEEKTARGPIALPASRRI